MTPREEGSARATHAIVIGAGIAGLTAARVLTDHFERVTLIERDRLPDTSDFRKGVPQARHFHILLVAGARILEQLFPGLHDDLAEADAPSVDWGWDTVLLFPHGQVLRRRTGLVVHFYTRALREWAIRDRLVRLPKVRVLDGCEVAGLVGDGRGVSGVRLRPRGPERGDLPQDGVLRADLVVDAGGRDSRNVEWLADLGFPPPQESAVNSWMSYTSRLLRRTAAHNEMPWRFVGDTPVPPDKTRGAILAAVERDAWILTLLGAAHDRPPDEEAPFLEWTRHLRTPLIHEIIKDAEPLSPIYGFRRTENRFRHFERMPRWPERFAVLGDAAVCFNPIYGQGMTFGAQSAVELGRCLEEHRSRQRSRQPGPGGPDLTGVTPAFQRRLAKLALAPWLLATGEDFRWPSTEGERPNAIMQLAQTYADQVLHLATEDDALAQQTFLEVQHGVKPPQGLFHPLLMAKVLKRALHARDRRRK